MTELTRHGNTFVLHLGDGENRFTPEWIDEVNQALGLIEATPGPRALVTTATRKIWSNGLDLAGLLADPESADQALQDAQALLARVLRLPVPSVAALQGHAFAAGAMLASCHDQVFMRSDRGCYCLPEVTLGLPFSAGMTSLLQARLTPGTCHEAMTTGRRYDGPEAVTAGIADRVLTEPELLSAAIAAAEALAPTAGITLGAIKERLYAPVLERLLEPALFPTPAAV